MWTNATVTVNCPICGETTPVGVEASYGEPAVMYYADGSGYPGSGPELVDAPTVDEIEFNCDCRAEIASAWGGITREEWSADEYPHELDLPEYDENIEAQIEREPIEFQD